MAEFTIVALPACEAFKTRLVSGKLHPIFFPDLTPEFAAIVGFILDLPYTRPKITAVTIEEGVIYAACASDDEKPCFSYEYLRKNWLSLLNAACLTPEERMEAECNFALRIGVDAETEDS